MYFSFVNTVDMAQHRRAGGITLLISGFLGAVLYSVSIGGEASAVYSLTSPIDTVELLIPLRVDVVPNPQPVARETGGGAAPAARFSPKVTPARPAAAAIKGTATPVVTQKTESPVETPAIDPSSLYKKTPHNGSGQAPKATTDHGGAPNGTPTGGYDGPSKGTGGIGLDVAGFRFGKLSVAQDPYDETGRVLFRVKVNAEGAILSLSVIETTVSMTITQWYKQQLSRLKLVPTSGGSRPEVSEGQITIRIRAK
jgi:hypothetical protein